MSIVTQSIGAYQDWTPTFTGFSANPATPVTRYSLNGKMCTVNIITGNGTSNLSTFTITLPFTAKTSALTRPSAITTDAGTIAAGWCSTRSGSNVMDVYRTPATLTWTTSGNKALVATFTYEID